MVTGQAPTSTDADAVVDSLTPYLADKEVLVNRMTIDRPLQVQLRVRITEVDRNVTQQLGINWQAMGNAVGNIYGGIFSGRSIYNLNNPITTPSGGTTYLSTCRPTTRIRCLAHSRRTMWIFAHWSTP